MSRATLTGLSGTNLGNLGPGGTLGSPVGIALYSPPDLHVSLGDTAGGGIPVGATFTWKAVIISSGAMPAYFTDGQVIFRDDLPEGAVYAVPTIALTENIANSGKISCTVASRALTCVASGGNVMFEAGSSQFRVEVGVTTTAVTSLTNPASGGVCRVDPGNNVVESNETDNDCSGRVDSNQLALGLKLYAGDLNGRISRADLDGRNGVSLGNLGFAGGSHAGLALDLPNGKLYFVLSTINRVARANLDGSGVEDLGNPGGFVLNPPDIALDVANNRMYITSYGNNKLVRASLTGGSAVDLGNPGGFLSQPTGIALDLSNGKVYIVSRLNSKIVRANLPDGSGGTDLGAFGGLLNGPNSIALDLPNGRMFITNYNSSKVVRANLDGSGAIDLGNPGGYLNHPAGIALDRAKGKMYIASITNSKIIRANLDGTGAQDLGSLGGVLLQPWGLALDLNPIGLYLPYLSR